MRICGCFVEMTHEDALLLSADRTSLAKRDLLALTKCLVLTVGVGVVVVVVATALSVDCQAGCRRRYLTLTL